MKNILRLALFVFAMAGANAQSAAQHPNSFSHTFDLGKLAALPTSSTCVVGSASTCAVVTKSIPYLCSYTLTGTGQTITIQDNQSTPVAFINAVLGASGAAVTAGFSYPDSGCVPMIGGVYWSAGASGATGDLVIKYN